MGNRNVVFGMVFLLALVFTFGAVGFAEGHDGDEATAKTGFPVTGKVVATELNVRSGAGQNYNRITALKFGTNVNVVEEVEVSVKSGKQVWYRIVAPEDISFFVSKMYVKADATGKIGEVTASRLNVRAKATLKSDVVGQVNREDRLEILAEEGEFYKVKAPEGFGVYVAAKYIRLGEGGSAEPVIDIVKPIVKPDRVADVSTAHDAEEIAAFRKVDSMYEEMVTNDILDWNFDAVVQAFGDLRKSVKDPIIQQNINSRLQDIDLRLHMKGVIMEMENTNDRNQTRIRELQDQLIRFQEEQRIKEEAQKVDWVFDGWVSGVGHWIGRPADFCVEVNDKATGKVGKFYLEPKPGTTLDFSQYLNDHVKVSGKIIRNRKGYDFVQVDKIEVIERK